MGEQDSSPNRGHWHGDHCFVPETVPGILFALHLLADYSQPSYKDMPALLIGKSVATRDVAHPPLSDEEQDVVQKRLKELGYL